MYHFGTIFLSFNLFQKMEMSYPGEETFFTKKIVHLSFLLFLFREMWEIINPDFKKKNIPPIRQKNCRLHPIPHTKNVLGGGGGAGEGRGATLGLFWGAAG